MGWGWGSKEGGRRSESSCSARSATHTPGRTFGLLELKARSFLPLSWLASEPGNWSRPTLPFLPASLLIYKLACKAPCRPLPACQALRFVAHYACHSFLGLGAQRWGVRCCPISSPAIQHRLPGESFLGHVPLPPLQAQDWTPWSLGSGDLDRETFDASVRQGMIMAEK